MGDYTLVASPAVADVSSAGTSQGGLPRTPGSGPEFGLSSVYSSAVGFSVMWWRFEAGAGVWGRLPITVGDADVTLIELLCKGRAGSENGRYVEPPRLT